MILLTNALVDRAIDDGYLRLERSGRAAKVVYTTEGRSQRWTDSEERVRAGFYAELIYRYGYPAERISVEVSVPDRSPRDFADIVVFHDDGRKRPFAVIECKSEGISDAEFAQAVEQSWGNGNAHKFRARYVGVVAGNTRRFLDCDERFGALERDNNVVSDLPFRYGSPPTHKYRKGVSSEWLDIQPVTKADLISAIRKCHQTLWGGGRLSPPAAFGEFCKIIFVKVRDENVGRRHGEPYEFQIRSDEPTHILGQRIRGLYEKERVREPDVFGEPIKADDGTLKTCVSHLEGINFTKTDLDTKGVAFEQFLDGFFKGDFGQYFTPREIIQLCVEVMNPSAEEFLLDPACGSGGFLLYAMDHVRHRADALFPDDEAAKLRHWHGFARDRLFGIEINEEISRVAKMNMILHDDGHTNIVTADALDRFPMLRDENRRLRRNAFDLILSNPPFGATVRESEKGTGYMQGWELLHLVGKIDSGDLEGETVAAKSRKSVKTEILFCERIWQLLKPATGRTAIVLPDGILTNASLQGVRTWLLSRFQLLAVISLPQTAFQHAGAGVKASVLFLRKRGEDELPDDSEPIFMAAPANIGYDGTGRKTFLTKLESEDVTSRTEIQSTDLFDVRVTYERAVSAIGLPDEWQERTRTIIPGTGVLGQYREFQQNPERFLS